ncbi:ATP-binding cassette domain-containing protein, partial [Corynebacterium sp. UMB4614]|uniref:ATP-binding cassette domain-containing protein n=1 Tax=Corynebacterium sp. UMB4614 TaxID=3046334 RepID=UPI00254A89E8
SQPDAPQTPHSHDIEIRGVSYAYDDTQALDEVSLSIPAGTVTALVGPSGAGKSTLASLIARFDDPDAGTITIGGVDLKN